LDGAKSWMCGGTMSSVIVQQRSRLLEMLGSDVKAPPGRNV
jgi:hypothetical protein